MKMDESFTDFVITVLVVVLVFCLLFGFLALLGIGIQELEPLIDLVVIYVLVFWGGCFLLVSSALLVFFVAEFIAEHIPSPIWLTACLLTVIGGIYYQEPIFEFLENDAQNTLDACGQKLFALCLQGIPFPIWMKIGSLIIFVIIFVACGGLWIPPSPPSDYEGD